MKDMRNEATLAERKEIARSFILMGELSYEKIAKGTKLPIEEIERMAGKEIIYKNVMPLQKTGNCISMMF